MICKITGKKIKPFMSFGKMPIANGFLRKKDFKKEFTFKMEVGFSKKISLFQLNDHPKPTKMFNNNYPFFTSSSKYMVDHFKKFSKWIKKNYFENNINVVEIGSNDGSFLKNFKSKKNNILGVEPSKNVASLATKRGVKTINKFFTHNNAKSLRDFRNNTHVICAANAICHIPNLKDLIKGIDVLLSKKGIFVFEEPYLGSMYKKTSYDQIYDEHIFMFSVSSIKKIFKLFEFELINVEPQSTHGGSMRYVVARQGEYKKDEKVKKYLKYEKKNFIDSLQGCLKFKKKCEISKKKLRNKILSIKKSNKTIAGYAATSKSTTILNYCGIDRRHIDFICDTTKEKINKYTPKTHIPIYDVNYYRNNIPDYTFLFAWNHKDEIFKKEKNILKKTKWFAHINF
jgi:SAM-dependent methyltransferase